MGFTHSPLPQGSFLNGTRGTRLTRLSVFKIYFSFFLSLSFSSFFPPLFLFLLFLIFFPFLIFFLPLLPPPPFFFFLFFFFFSAFFYFSFIFPFPEQQQNTQKPAAGGVHSVRCCSVAPLFPAGGQARREPPSLLPTRHGTGPFPAGLLGRARPSSPLLSAERGYDKRRQGSERI